jgi:hypothetical protein
MGRKERKIKKDRGNINRKINRKGKTRRDNGKLRKFKQKDKQKREESRRDKERLRK